MPETIKIVDAVTLSPNGDGTYDLISHTGRLLDRAANFGEAMAYLEGYYGLLDENGGEIEKI